MNIVGIILHFIGALSFLLYGMKMMSDGIQKSAGKTLRGVLRFMTNNRLFAVLSGTFVTLIIQSSSATTVMLISFVNAGILTLEQAIGTIFGANIGTTGTAWIVSLVGFKLKFTAFALPAFGIGFLLCNIKRLHQEGWGEALMGFGLLFLGLDWLGETIPQLDQDKIKEFMLQYAGSSIGNRIMGIIVGTIVTIILDSSSAVTALIITMAYSGLLSWDFSCALVLGSNIGTTTDVIFSSIGAKADTKRAAAVHVFFNVVGSIIAAFFFTPLINLVDYITPGDPRQGEAIAIHISMFHTVFNVCCTLIFLPFVSQIARFTRLIIKSKKYELSQTYTLTFEKGGIKDNAEGHIIRAEHEITDMTRIAYRMFTSIKDTLAGREHNAIAEKIPQLTEEENYIDQMREEITNYLLRCYDLPLGDKNRNYIHILQEIVNDIERMSDDCFTLAMLLKKSEDKTIPLDEEHTKELLDYAVLAESFLDFVGENITGARRKLPQSVFETASRLEDQIDERKRSMKKLAEHRLEKGGNVKSELLYIDLVRNIEKAGDCAFDVARNLARRG